MSDLGNQSDPEVEALAEEIVRYLRLHRSAADTAEGIARWWIKRQRLEETLIRVQQALDYLVADSQIKAQRTGSGSTLYMLPEQSRPQH